MIEAEVKQLVERALVIDSLICQQLGLAWERPPMPFMELSGPIQPKKQALQSNQRVMGASVEPKLETHTGSTAMEMYQEGTAVQSEGGAEVEQVKLSMETVMELLCDEAVRDRFKIHLQCSGRTRT